MTRVQVIDSHTGGEPTRVVIDGGPDLGRGTLAERRERFRTHHDSFRSAIVNEPRGSDVLVGAMLVEPHEPNCLAGVIFFNNVGVLNMCGHGTIGLAVTLAHMGRITTGKYRLDTPVGVVGFEYHGDNRVTVENVPSYRHAEDVEFDVEGIGRVTGDVAWGGNWFFLTNANGLALESRNIESLTNHAWRVRRALEKQKITGANGGEIDHIEIVGPAADPAHHARNFVLCPGGAYDRSPCGTGTSAKVACLAAEGKLKPGETWRQESVIGSVFEASYRFDQDGRVIPSVTGTAFVTGEATLLFDRADPFRNGVRS